MNIEVNINTLNNSTQEGEESGVKRSFDESEDDDAMSCTMS